VQTKQIWMSGLAATLAACGGAGLDGRWQGQCSVDTTKGEAQYALDYGLSTEGEAIDGAATVEAPFLTEPIGGTIGGSLSRRDDRVDLVVELGDPVLNFTLRHGLTLDRDAETLSGPCSVQVQDEDPFEGTSSLSRTGDAEGE